MQHQASSKVSQGVSEGDGHAGQMTGDNLLLGRIGLRFGNFASPGVDVPLSLVLGTIQLLAGD